MRKYALFFVFILVLSTLFLSALAIAQEPASETAPAVNPVPLVPPAPPPDAPNPAAAETNNPSLTETTTITSTTLTTNTTLPNASTPGTPPSEQTEGTSYKEVPWGADYNTFRDIKKFPGDLGPLSAAFIGNNDDNIIAIILGAPTVNQRVMFEYVPRTFASVYLEADDTYYIFYNGKFALAFARINEKIFEPCRDAFYKKYTKVGTFFYKYDLAANKTYALNAIIFEKGKTKAFLIKGQLHQGKNIAISARILFASDELFNAIRREIRNKAAKGNLPGNDLEKDLNKIE